MNTKILLVLVAFVLVGLGAYLLMSQSSSKKPEAAIEQTPTPVSKADEKVGEETKVTLTNSGFAPSTLRVKAGTKVIWENKSQRMATVDSDIHPTHRLYPFLNLGNFSPGENLSVTFDKADTFTYHNHINSSQTGTVVVE
jgi:plastocyanin